jgi:hypothetical protein
LLKAEPTLFVALQNISLLKYSSTKVSLDALIV